VAGNPFYRFLLSGPISQQLSAYFLFISADPVSKELSLSLSFQIFTPDSVRYPEDYIQNTLWPEAPSVHRGVLYREAGIADPLELHRKAFPDLFPLLEKGESEAGYDNPDLRDLLDSCCFGSLLYLERLLSELRELPQNRLFIADQTLRTAQATLQVTLQEEGLVPVPLIDIEALQRDNDGVDSLSTIIADAEHYNAFARALWEHVKSEIVADRGTDDRDPYSIADAGGFYFLDEDISIDKRLLKAAARSDCDQLALLKKLQTAGEANDFGPQFFIQPTIYNNISRDDQPKAHQLIAHLYQHTYDSAVVRVPRRIANFLIGVRKSAEIAYDRIVNLSQLDSYQIAEDTNDDKFSCRALLSVVPDELQALSPMKFKNCFAQNFLAGLKILLSPVREGVLHLIDMDIPEEVFVSTDEGKTWVTSDAVLQAGYNLISGYQSPTGKIVGGVLKKFFKNYSYFDTTYTSSDFDKDRELYEGDQVPVHGIYTVCAFWGSEGRDRAQDWLNACAGCLSVIRDDPLSGPGTEVSGMGIFFSKPVVYYVVSRLQQLIAACLADQRTTGVTEGIVSEGAADKDTIDRLVGIFQTFAQQFKDCPMGRFTGISALVPRLAFGDDSFVVLSLKDMLNVAMNMSVEERLSNVFSNVPGGNVPHYLMVLRQEIDGMYGLMADEDPDRHVLRNRMPLGLLLDSARQHGVDVSPFEKDFGSLSFMSSFEIWGIGYNLDDPRNKKWCKKLIRLVMTPGAVISTFARNPLCSSILKKFPAEEHHLPDNQINTLLGNADMKRQVIADLLRKYGYLVPKGTEVPDSDDEEPVSPDPNLATDGSGHSGTDEGAESPPPGLMNRGSDDAGSPPDSPDQAQDQDQEVVIPPVERDALYSAAAIEDALELHRKIFPDLFSLLEGDYDNPDLRELLNGCCFGSLLDLERLLSQLKKLPETCAFIANARTREKVKGFLIISLTDEDPIPLINVEALQRDNDGVDSLSTIIADAKHYNTFARALWEHVKSTIVANENVHEQAPCSIEYAAETIGILGSDVLAEKRLLEATAQSHCHQLSVLSVSDRAHLPGYFGSLWFILPAIYRNISEADRPGVHQLIRHLYQYAHDRIATLPPDGIARFLREVVKAVEAANAAPEPTDAALSPEELERIAQEAREIPYHKTVDLEQLEHYILAEDTNDGKFSCEAAIPDDLRELPAIEIKNRFVRALLSSLRILLSPIQWDPLQPTKGTLQPIAMTIPEQTCEEGISISVSMTTRNEIAKVFKEYFGTGDADKWHSNWPHCMVDQVLAVSWEPVLTADGCATRFGIWLDGICGDHLNRETPETGIFFDLPMALYVIAHLERLADECLTQKNPGQIRKKIEQLLGIFNIIAGRFTECSSGRALGMMNLFAYLSGDDPCMIDLPAKDRINAVMKSITERRLDDILAKCDPHNVMAFREALNKMYGITGKEPPSEGHPNGSFCFYSVVSAVQKYGIDIGRYFYTAWHEDPEEQKIFVKKWGDYEDQRNSTVQAKCRQLMRLVMTPQAVIDEFAKLSLCPDVLKKFLKEAPHDPSDDQILSDDQITILLRDADMKRQVIADLLWKYGYLMD